MQVSWAGAGLGMTLRKAIEPFDTKTAGRFVLSGPEIDIASAAVIALAMTVNELCTNATKFGALSDPAGRVKIEWAIDPTSQRLSLKWTETGGPHVYAPTRRSFGTRMMESLGQQLSGAVHLAYPPAGFTYNLEVPVSSMNP
jgi:two-component sensor histidine kinase